MKSIILFWAEHGVRIFRVDNPHTKPVAVLGISDFRCAREISRRDFSFRGFHATENDEGAGQSRLHPELHLFHLAQSEAGADRIFHRTDPDGDARIFPRQSLAEHARYFAARICRRAGARRLCIRAVLAATFSSVYGIYSGFELCEKRRFARPRRISRFGKISV